MHYLVMAYTPNVKVRGHDVTPLLHNCYTIYF